MKYNKLGRTELMASIAGLGCGGKSRIGLSKGLGNYNAIKIIKIALDVGVNFFDTSSAYGTEEVLGKGLKSINRDKFIISSKFPPVVWGKDIKPENSLTLSLEQSLKTMKLEYIDILHLHGVKEEDYINVRDRFMPELIKAKQTGKIGWFGITEMFGQDTNHTMLQRALDDDLWDVIMLGLNILNFSANDTLLPITKNNNVGTLLMFAVRNALSQNTRLLEIMDDLIKRDEINPKLFSKDAPLDFLTQNDIASSVMEAAYRFCSHTDWIDVVLTGTSSHKHLIDNVDSILSSSLPSTVLDKIYDIFGNVDSVSGQ